MLQQFELGHTSCRVDRVDPFPMTFTSRMSMGDNIVKAHIIICTLLLLAPSAVNAGNHGHGRVIQRMCDTDAAGTRECTVTYADGTRRHYTDRMMGMRPSDWSRHQHRGGCVPFCEGE